MRSGRDFQRTPTTTQSAVFSGFTLTTAPRPPGFVRPVEPLRDHAVEADRLEVGRASRARRCDRVVAGESGMPVDAASSERCRRSSSGALPTRVALPERAGRRRRRSPGSRPRAGGCGSRRDGAASASRRSRARRRGRSRSRRRAPSAAGARRRAGAARGSSAAAGARCATRGAARPTAFSSTPRKPSHFGSYCQPSLVGELAHELRLHGRERDERVEVGRAGRCFGHGVQPTTLWASCDASASPGSERSRRSASTRPRRGRRPSRAAAASTSSRPSTRASSRCGSRPR